MSKRRVALDVATCAMMSAMLTAVKLALSWIPNVEAVSVLIVVFALGFGLRRTLTAVNCFILTEIILYPAHIWILCYFIHWNTLAIVVYFVGKIKENSILLAIVVAFLTFLFGVSTTTFEVLVGNSIYSFWKAFAIRYAAGTWYFVTHIVCNFLTVSILTPVLLPVVRKLLKSQRTEGVRREDKTSETEQPERDASPTAEPNKADKIKTKTDNSDTSAVS